jgi:hypothetical protein
MTALPTAQRGQRRVTATLPITPCGHRRSREPRQLIGDSVHADVYASAGSVNARPAWRTRPASSAGVLDRIAESPRLARQVQTPASAAHESIRAGQCNRARAIFAAEAREHWGTNRARIWRINYSRAGSAAPKPPSRGNSVDRALMIMEHDRSSQLICSTRPERSCVCRCCRCEAKGGVVNGGFLRRARLRRRGRGRQCR